MYKKLSTALIALLFILAASYFYFTAQQPNEVYIERVIDGDTVQTAAGKSIRLLAVDCPEIDWENRSSEFYAEEAREFTQKKLLKQNVLLKFDQEQEDDYGRTLAYIYLDGENFNQKLLKEGYATVMIVEPNDRYENEFKMAQEEARRDNKGIWSQILTLEKSLPLISFKEADQFIGKEVIVEGEIVDTAATASVNYLNFSFDYQNDLSLVIFNQDLNKFSYQPADFLKDKKIKVLGRVELYQGSPQIVVNQPHNILIID